MGHPSGVYNFVHASRRRSRSSWRTWRRSSASARTHTHTPAAKTHTNPRSRIPSIETQHTFGSFGWQTPYRIIVLFISAFARTPRRSMWTLTPRTRRRASAWRRPNKPRPIDEGRASPAARTTMRTRRCVPLSCPVFILDAPCTYMGYSHVLAVTGRRRGRVRQSHHGLGACQSRKYGGRGGVCGAFLEERGVEESGQAEDARAVLPVSSVNSYAHTHSHTHSRTHLLSPSLIWPRICLCLALKPECCLLVSHRAPASPITGKKTSGLFLFINIIFSCLRAHIFILQQMLQAGFPAVEHSLIEQNSLQKLPVAPVNTYILEWFLNFDLYTVWDVCGVGIGTVTMTMWRTSSCSKSSIPLSPSLTRWPCSSVRYFPYMPVLRACAWTYCDEHPSRLGYCRVCACFCVWCGGRSVSGYLALFAPAFPLAPLFAFINNVFEIRIDAIKFCYILKRPAARQAQDIGAWYTVLNVLGFFAVLTNATMIAFVGSQVNALLRASRTPYESVYAHCTSRAVSRIIFEYNRSENILSHKHCPVFACSAMCACVQLAEPDEVGGPNGWTTNHVFHPGSEHDGKSGMVLRWSMQVTCLTAKHHKHSIAHASHAWILSQKSGLLILFLFLCWFWFGFCGQMPYDIICAACVQRFWVSAVMIEHGVMLMRVSHTYVTYVLSVSFLTMHDYLPIQVAHFHTQPSDNIQRTHITDNLYTVNRSVILMRLSPESPSWVANARDRMEFRYNQWIDGAQAMLQAGMDINAIHDEIYSWDAGNRQIPYKSVFSVLIDDSNVHIWGFGRNIPYIYYDNTCADAGVDDVDTGEDAEHTNVAIQLIMAPISLAFTALGITKVRARSFSSQARMTETPIWIPPLAAWMLQLSIFGRVTDKHLRHVYIQIDVSDILAYFSEPRRDPEAREALARAGCAGQPRHVTAEAAQAGRRGLAGRGQGDDQGEGRRGVVADLNYFYRVISYLCVIQLGYFTGTAIVGVYYYFEFIRVPLIDLLYISMLRLIASVDVEVVSDNLLNLYEVLEQYLRVDGVWRVLDELSITLHVHVPCMYIVSTVFDVIKNLSKTRDPARGETRQIQARERATLRNPAARRSSRSPQRNFYTRNSCTTGSRIPWYRIHVLYVSLSEGRLPPAGAPRDRAAQWGYPWGRSRASVRGSSARRSRAPTGATRRRTRCRRRRGPGGAEQAADGRRTGSTGIPSVEIALGRS
eukprot:46890_4